jgi:hypothetical protein
LLSFFFGLGLAGSWGIVLALAHRYQGSVKKFLKIFGGLGAIARNDFP